MRRTRSGPARSPLGSRPLLGLLGGLLLAFALLGAALPAARAADEPDASSEGLRRGLLEATTPGAWEGVLAALFVSGPEQVAAVLAPLYIDAGLSTGRPELLAFCSAYLAAHPIREGSGERILLADLVLARVRAADRRTFVQALRSHLVVDWRTGRSPDWERLLLRAQAALAPSAGSETAASAAERLGALALLGQAQGRELERVLPALAVFARQLAGAPPAADRLRLEGALLDTLDELLTYRFSSPAEAASTLESPELRGLSQMDLVRLFSRRKDAAARDHQLVLRHGARVIEHLDNPAAMARAVELDEFPYPDLRRAFVERLAQLKPRPGAGWDDLFVHLLQRWPDPEPVSMALDLLVTAGFGAGGDDCCPTIAQAVQERLHNRPAGPDGDPPELRVRLVAALGDLASQLPLELQVRSVLERRSVTPEEQAEVVELILAVGKGPGARVETMLKPFYDLEGLAPEVREALRVAVVKALGRPGVRKHDPQAAVEALEGLLEGQSGWSRAVSPRVREQALRSLAQHPSAGTAQFLLSQALRLSAEGDEDARTALQMLGQMASLPAGAEPAAEALLSFLRSVAENPDADERRVLALKGLKNLPASLPAPVAGAVREAVRALLAAPGSFDLRTQAARTCADLADAEALGPALAWWKEQSEPGRVAAARELAGALLEAVVRAGAPGADGAAGPNDEQVASALEALAARTDEADTAVTWAESLLRVAARAGAPRPRLLEAQAAVLLERARSREGPSGAAARLADLRAALAALDVAQQTPAPDLATAARRSLLALRVQEQLALTLGPGPEGKGLLLRAVALAARSMSPAVLRAGERIGRQVLGAAPWKPLLNAAEQAALQGQLDQIQQAMERAGP